MLQTKEQYKSQPKNEGYKEPNGILELKLQLAHTKICIGTILFHSMLSIPL